MYQRKDRTEKRVDYMNHFGLGGKVVLSFIDEIEKHHPGKKFSFYFDNFFTSICLLEEIQKRSHGATGTLRSNRVEKYPLIDSKKFGKLPRDTEEHFLEKDTNIIVVRWNDNGIVCIASNQHGLLHIKKAERYSAAEKKKIVSVPHIINMYNCNMGGVDRMDENISHYRISIRGKKWIFPYYVIF